MRSMYKSELADAAGVCRQTFSRWLRTDRDALLAMGVCPSAHLLPPCAVRYLADKYAIDLPPP